MNKQFSFLSGLPRTGSTLLSSILSQNPNIHTEGISQVCNLLWNIVTSSANENLNDWHVDILISNRQRSIKKIIEEIPKIYYYDVNKPLILDNNRNWILPGNVQVIKNYMTSSPKIIVLVRPVDEIVSSFVHIRKKNGWKEESLFEGLLEDNTHPITIPLGGILWAKENNQGEYLFVHYDDIVFNTKKTLEKIYDFCEWPKYEHQLDNINRPFIQNDEVYNLKGLHDVRRNVEKQKYHIDLPKDIIKKCRYLNSLLFED
jgi:sulfotransferase